MCCGVLYNRHFVAAYANRQPFCVEAWCTRHERTRVSQHSFRDGQGATACAKDVYVNYRRTCRDADKVHWHLHGRRQVLHPSMLSSALKNDYPSRSRPLVHLHRPLPCHTIPYHTIPCIISPTKPQQLGLVGWTQFDTAKKHIHAQW